MFFDPKAFAEVLESGVPIILSPLHLGLDHALPNERYYSIHKKRFKEYFIEKMIRGSYEPLLHDHFALHDAHVILGLLYPSLYKFKKCDINISLEKENFGQTSVSLNLFGKHKVQLAKNSELIKEKLFSEIYK